MDLYTTENHALGMKGSSGGETYPLGENNPQEKDEQQASSCEPALENMGCPAIQELLVLALYLGVLKGEILDGRRVDSRAGESGRRGLGGGHHGC